MEQFDWFYRILIMQMYYTRQTRPFYFLKQVSYSELWDLFSHKPQNHAELYVFITNLQLNNVTTASLNVIFKAAVVKPHVNNYCKCICIY